MLNLSRKDWSKVMHLLDDALDLSVAARAQWLATLAPEHRPLESALRQLLDDRAAIETGDFLEQLPALAPQPGTEGIAHAVHTGHGLVAGQCIGPYELLRELGHGGMASVWLAERADGAHKRAVALKLPWLGARSRVIGERFERERDILSALTHPHIASVLDAGHEGAQPWLAMEYVEGVTLIAHAERERLDVPARLRLFGQVLKAVQHAHAQLVIHRDLKPSNVLVDTTGQVKLLDFGVAKLLNDAGATQETELTQIGGRALTPQYASPEQVAGHPLGTASDVYSLGVLLYELLTGRLPYTLKRATPAALEDAILAAHVDKPSAVVADKAVQKALRGDVDTLVLKALAAVPGDRFASAEAFAQDIERHLQSRPILARPASTAYVFGRWARRHGWSLAAGSAVLLALVVGLGTTLWQADRARAEARRAEAVQAFLVKVMSFNNPEQAQGRELSARELLSLSAGQIDTDFAGQPDVQARLHHTVAQIQISMGLIPPARAELERALPLYGAGRLRGSAEHVEAMFNLSEVFDELREYDAERAALQQTSALAEQHFGKPNRWSARVLTALSWIAKEQGDLDGGVRYGEQALEQAQLFSGERSVDALKVRGVLADAYLTRGDLRQGLAQHEAAYVLGPQTPGYELTDQLVDAYNLARARFNFGEFAQAFALLQTLAPRVDQHLGAQHDRAFIVHSLKAQARAELGEVDAGVAEQRLNLANAIARHTPDDEAVALQQATLAKLLMTAGRFDEGIPLARTALAYLDRKYPQPNTARERVRWVLGSLLLGVGQVHEGTALVEQSLAGLRSLGNASHVTPDGLLSRAVAWRTGDRLPEALADVRQACSVMRGELADDAMRVLRCEAVAAWLAALAAEPAQRAAALQAFVVARERLWPKLHPQHALRAELVVAESEILRRDPTQAGAAGATFARGQAQYQASLGQRLPPQMLLIH